MKYFEKITNLLIQHNLLRKDLAPWFNYAMQHFALSFLGVLLLFVFGSLISGYIATAFFSLSFLVLRKCIGGWHASSPFKCLFLSIFCEMICLGLFYPLLLSNAIITSYVLCFFATVVVFVFAPLLPKALHETKEQRLALKKFSRRTILIETLITVIFTLCFPAYALYASLGISCAAFSLLIERFTTLKKEGITK